MISGKLLDRIANRCNSKEDELVVVHYSKASICGYLTPRSGAGYYGIKSVRGPGVVVHSFESSTRETEQADFYEFKIRQESIVRPCIKKMGVEESSSLYGWSGSQDRDRDIKGGYVPQ